MNSIAYDHRMWRDFPITDTNHTGDYEVDNIFAPYLA